MTSKPNEPRKHHFLPQCWLAGFTPTGDKDERFFVTDILRRKQREDKPVNVGYKKDFYRASDGGDPVRWERTFGEMETIIAPLLKHLFASPRDPNADELYALLVFAAVQFIRVPTFRPFIRRVAEANYRDALSRILKSAKYWRRIANRYGLSDKLTYEEALDLQRGGVITGTSNLNFGNEFFVQRGFAGLSTILTQLETRHWQSLISPTGSFIGSDTPIVMDGPAQIGFKTAEIIHIPVNRFLLLRGTTDPAIEEPLTRKTIAAINSFALLNTQEQVYSSCAEFAWTDEHFEVRYNWDGFSKDAIVQSLKTGRLPGLVVRTAKRE